MSTKKKPAPLLSQNETVDWFFAFKFNSKTMPGCKDDGKAPAIGSKGIFGGFVKDYEKDAKVLTPGSTPVIRYGQQYIVASSKNPQLTKGVDCIGTTLHDPVGATFAQIYNTNDFSYLIWNDQLYGHPQDNAGSMDHKTGKWINSDIPWGHSKGMLAWNEDGEGFVMQVSTPSWPASGSHLHPRTGDGNTLGCITDDDVEVSQHFFCLGISKSDLISILKALINASVVTVPDNPELSLNRKSPSDINDLVKKVGKLNSSREMTVDVLSSGVKLISKPSLLNSPPWQLVSSTLDGLPLLVASWWAYPALFSTDEHTRITCWPSQMKKPGIVEIALTGLWNGTTIGFLGRPEPNGNHAKFAVSKDKSKPYCIFGDMNQMGALNPVRDDRNPNNKELTCNIHQNGRGGLFYALQNKELFESLTKLMDGETAPFHNESEIKKSSH